MEAAWRSREPVTLSLTPVASSSVLSFLLQIQKMGGGGSMGSGAARDEETALDMLSQTLELPQTGPGNQRPKAGIDFCIFIPSLKIKKILQVMKGTHAINVLGRLSTSRKTWNFLP